MSEGYHGEGETPDQVIERAVYAALGCTDTRVQKAPAASEQIRRFVTKELDEAGYEIKRRA